MSDDVILAKAAIIERCIRRAREELAAATDFRTDLTRQDAAILNVQRACEAGVDVAFRLVRMKGLGAPSTNREAFDVLASAGLIPSAQADLLKRMVGFRNVAVHRYTDLDVEIVAKVIRTRLDDLAAFSAFALKI